MCRREPFHVAKKGRIIYITLAFDMPADAAAFLLRQRQAARRCGWGDGGGDGMMMSLRHGSC